MYERVVNNPTLILFLLACIVAVIFSISVPVFAAHNAGHAEDPATPQGDPSADPATQTPPAAAPRGALLRDGIFGCNASKYANIGSLSAIGGIYVPVNDAAVTLNTGYLVYKECVLDGVVSKISEAARTEVTATTVRQLNTGRNGKPRYPVNLFADLKEVNDRTQLVNLSTEMMEPIHPAFRDEIQRIEARRYLANRSAPQNAYGSSYPGSAEELKAVLGGKGKDPLKELGYLIQLGNDPASSQLLKSTFDASTRAAARYAQEKVWDWGNGFYAATDNAENPFAEKILTPSYLVSQGAAQVITAGFRCLEGADEPSEVCAPMFNALASAAIDRGLSSLTKAQNGLPSYVSRMVSEASSAVRQEAVNAALNILLTSRQIEAFYKRAKDGIAEVLTAAINRLRSAERECWELIINNVCQNTPDQDKRCQSKPVCTKTATGEEQCSTPFTLEVATTTEFSQAVINAEILPIAELVAADIKKSANALSLIDQIIASVTNTASATNQRAALERLDTMVANGQLHTSNDATNANKQLEDVTGSANTLVEDTLKAWGDSTDPTVGWCNVNNPSLIAKWITSWRK